MTWRLNPDSNELEWSPDPAPASPYPDESSRTIPSYATAAGITAPTVAPPITPPLPAPASAPAPQQGWGGGMATPTVAPDPAPPAAPAPVVTPAPEPQPFAYPDESSKTIPGYATPTVAAPAAAPSLPAVDPAQAWALYTGDDSGVYPTLPQDETEVRRRLQIWGYTPSAADIAAIMADLPGAVTQGRMADRQVPLTGTLQGGDYVWGANDLGRVIRGDYQPPPAAASTDGSEAYHDRMPNPPFASVRGGPTLPRNAGRNSTTAKENLADYLQAAGVPGPIADILRREGATFAKEAGRWSGIETGQHDLWGNPLFAAAPGVSLGGFLQNPSEGDVLQAGRHELVHRWDFGDSPMVRSISEDPTFRGLIDQARRSGKYPYLTEKVPDPGDYAHAYTAAFDQTLRPADLPPGLARFYRDPQGNSLLTAGPFLTWYLQRLAATPVAGPYDTHLASSDPATVPTRGPSDPGVPGGPGPVLPPPDTSAATAQSEHDLAALQQSSPASVGLAAEAGAAVGTTIEQEGQQLQRERERLQAATQRGELTPGDAQAQYSRLVTEAQQRIQQAWDKAAAPTPTPDQNLLARRTVTPQQLAEFLAQQQAAKPSAPTGPDLSGALEIPGVKGTLETLGAGLRGAGSMPITPIPGSPTVGDVAGTVGGALKAEAEFTTGAARALGISPPSIPVLGGPSVARTPAAVAQQARDAISAGIVARKPQNPVELLGAAIESVREYERSRPESYPGERVLSESLFSASNLLGLGLERSAADALAKSGLWQGVRKAGATLAEQAAADTVTVGGRTARRGSGLPGIGGIPLPEGDAGAAAAGNVAKAADATAVPVEAPSAVLARLQQENALAGQPAVGPAKPVTAFDPLSHPDTAAEAEQIVAADTTAAKNQLLDHKDPLTEQDRAVGHTLIQQAQAAGDSETAGQVAMALASRAAEAGDPVAGKAAIAALTPDSVVKLAQGYVKEAQDKGWRTAKLSPQKEQLLRQQTAAVNALAPGRQQTLAAGELLRNISELVPPTFARRLSTYQVMAQLLNPKTVVRNLVGNSLFAGFENLTRLAATGMDIPVSKLTGQRSVTLPSIGVQAKGLARGAKEGAQEAVRGINLSDPGVAGKFELGQGRTFPFGVQEVTEPGLSPLQRAGRIAGMPLHYAETGLNLALAMPDRAAYQAAFDDDLLNLARVQAMNKGLSGKEAGAHVQQLLQNPPQWMVESAKATALFRTFNNESTASAIFSGLKKGLNIVGVGRRLNPETGVFNLDRWSREFGLGDFIEKYPRMPANLLLRAADYSPLGFLGAMKELAPLALNKPFNQKAFVEQTARATLGTAGLTGAGKLLADVGLVKGQPSGNYNADRVRRLEGLGPYRINLDGFRRFMTSGLDKSAAKVQEGDRWVTYDWAQPLSVSFGFGANLSQARRTGPPQAKRDEPPAGSVFDQISRGLTAGLEPLAVGMDTLDDQSLVSGVLDAFGSPDDPTKGIVNVLKRAPSSMVPTLLSQVQQAISNTTPETYDPSVVKQSLNYVLAKVPLLAATLPERVDPWGSPEDRWKDGSNSLFNVFVNPVTIGEYLPAPEARMVLDLERTTGLGDQFPQSVPTKLTIDGATYALSPEQYTQYQTLLGQKTREAFNNLARSDAFRERSPQDQVQFLGRVLGDLTVEAQQELRKLAQEEGGGVSPLSAGPRFLPKPDFRKAQPKLNEGNAARLAEAQPLLQQYDAIPQQLQDLVPAYASAARQYEEALKAHDPDQVRAVLADPTYRTYENAVRVNRDTLRRQQPKVDHALQEWRAMTPVGQRTLADISDDLAQHFVPLGLPYDELNTATQGDIDAYRKKLEGLAGKKLQLIPPGSDEWEALLQQAGKPTLKNPAPKVQRGPRAPRPGATPKPDPTAAPVLLPSLQR